MSATSYLSGLFHSAVDGAPISGKISMSHFGEDQPAQPGLSLSLAVCRSSESDVDTSSISDRCGILPLGRFALDATADSPPSEIVNRMMHTMENVELFDASAFRISPAESEAMDPQQRILLESVLHARRGIDGRDLIHRSGVVVGASGSQYFESQSIGPHSAVGSQQSVLCGRVSYAFGLKGPSVCVDTACSSSLVATHISAESVKTAACGNSIAAGIMVSSGMVAHSTLSAARMLSADGRCKTLDISADGYGRGECCGVVHIDRVSDGDASTSTLLVGTGVNQDGRSSSLTAPNGPSQQMLIADTMRVAGVSGDSVAQLEMHGTGTSLGDPIEVGAASTVLCGASKATASDSLILQAAKSHIGHCEPGAGIIGIVSAMSRLGAVTVSSLQHLRTLNPHVEAIVKRLEPGDDAQTPRVCTISMPRQRIASALTLCENEGFAARMVCGVSGFAFQGTNAHVLAQKAHAPSSCVAIDAMALRMWNRTRSWYMPPLHVMVTRVFHDIRMGDDALRSAASISESPALSDMCDHLVSGRAILPGAAHIEVARAAAQQLVSASAGSLGMCGIVFSAPLDLNGDGVVECCLDFRGGVSVGTVRPSGYGQQSFSTRSSGTIRSMVGKGGANGVAPPTTHRAMDPTNAAMDPTNANQASRVILCSTQTLGAHDASAYHISPAILDSVLQSSTALVSRSPFSASNPGSGSSMTHIALSTATESPRVPASAQGAIMDGRQGRCIKLLGSSAVERVAHRGQSSVTSHHKVWGRANGSSSRCASRVHGLVSKSMHRGIKTSAGSRDQQQRRKCGREASLARTLYVTRWQARGGAGQTSRHARRSQLLARLACHSHSLRRTPPTWIEAVGAGQQMCRPNMLNATLASIQGSSNERMHQGMHLETASAFDQAGCAGTPKRVTSIIGVESRAMRGLSKSTMLEGTFQDTLSMADFDSESRNVSRENTPADGAWFRNGLVSSRGGALYTERLLACETMLVREPVKRPRHRRRVWSCARNDDDAYTCARHQGVVTGGLGGLGVLASTWLSQGGLHTSTLTGRSGRSALAPSHVLSARPTGVRMVRADAGCSDDMQCSAGRGDVRRPAEPPVAGVIHSGGAILDAPIARQSSWRVRGVIGGKAGGALRLAQGGSATMADNLEWCAMFSSVASMIGSPAQSNYSAANAMLDARALEMQREGMDALAIQWGAWTASGMATKASHTLRRTVAGGFGAVSPESGLSALGRVLGARARERFAVGAAVIGMSPVGWTRAMSRLASAAVARASEFVQAQDLRAAIDGESLIELSSPTPAALGDVDTLVLTAKDTSDVAMDPSTVVTRAVAGALGRDVERDAPLMEEGLDSLSAVELGNTLQTATGIEMPATLVFDYPSQDAIIEYLDGAISKHRTQSRTTEKRSEVTKRMAIVGDADNRGSEVAQRTFKLETCEARGLVLNALGEYPGMSATSYLALLIVGDIFVNRLGCDSGIHWLRRTSATSKDPHAMKKFTSNNRVCSSHDFSHGSSAVLHQGDLTLARYERMSAIIFATFASKTLLRLLSILLVALGLVLLSAFIRVVH